jgi:type IV pilus assembly protein PilE
VTSKQRAFSLIELLIVIVVLGVLARIAYPQYLKQIVKASRQSAQSQLLELSNLQEKIFLNSSLYTGSVSNPYTGLSSGGLGITSSTTYDAKYSLALAPTTASTSYTLTATPVSGSSQDGDGNLSIDSTGKRLWGSANW